MPEEKNIAFNRKARHDYHIEETYEAGIVLTGTEIKSIRASMINLRDSYAKVEKDEVFMYNAHISLYEQGNRYNHDPLRPRKLLLNKREIRKLLWKTQEKGLTLVPLRIYLTRGRAKVELAVARGKKLYDKREDIAKRDANREIQRAFREKFKE